MSVNATELNNLLTDLYHVCDALIAGKRVWLRDPVDGWVITRMVNPARNSSDYHVGDIAPGIYKDIEGKHPCEDGDTVALWVSPGEDRYLMAQREVSKRPTIHFSDEGFWIDGSERDGRWIESVELEKP